MQGIVSILRSDNSENPVKAASLRRTLSADMSSKRWLVDNGLPLITKTKIGFADQKTTGNSSSSSDSSESDEEECEITPRKGEESPRRIDIWTAIMSKKKEDDSSKLPPPYVHPLVQKSSRSLSEKSLKICTESLGSETGSDVLSLSSSFVKDDDNKHEENMEHNSVLSPSSEKDGDTAHEENEEHKVVKFACLPTKKPQQARSLPPPLPSLATARTDAPSLQVHSRRVNGRLVLEAVSVPPQKYFEAQRQDGRFRLTLVNDVKEESSENVDEDEDRIKSYSANKDVRILNNHQSHNPTKTMINIHKSTVTVKRMMERDNENPAWSGKLNTKQGKMTKPTLPRSKVTGLPPLPPAATSAALINSYQYFWRSKPCTASIIDPLMTQQRPPTKTKDLVLLRGNKVDCVVPSMKGCKEPRRSHLMWEPFCIATS